MPTAHPIPDFQCLALKERNGTITIVLERRRGTLANVGSFNTNKLKFATLKETTFIYRVLTN